MALAFLPPFLKKLPDNSRNKQSNSPWWPLPLLCQLCSEWLLTPSHKVSAGVWTDKEMDPWWPPRPWKKRLFHFLPSIFSYFILVKHELFCWHRPYLKKHLFCVIVISKGCSLIPLTGNLSSEGWKQKYLLMPALNSEQCRNNARNRSASAEDLQFSRIDYPLTLSHLYLNDGSAPQRHFAQTQVKWVPLKRQFGWNISQ